MLALAPTAIGYGWGAVRLHRRGDRWPASRSLSFSVGWIVLAASLMPPLADTTHFRVHVVQHLMLAMLAPLALARSGPVTLALRTLPHRPRRTLLRLLHGRFARVLTFAPVVLALEVGGMYAYYLTPLFAATMHTSALHIAVHTHMFLAGCLFSWYLVGADPLPGGRSVPAALTTLFVAAGSHDLLAKVTYAHLLPRSAGSAEQIHDGARIMFYGGDGIELLLATCLLATWYTRTGRALAHQRRRATTASVDRRACRPARPAA